MGEEYFKEVPFSFRAHPFRVNGRVRDELCGLKINYKKQKN